VQLIFYPVHWPFCWFSFYVKLQLLGLAILVFRCFLSGSCTR